MVGCLKLSSHPLLVQFLCNRDGVYPSRHFFIFFGCGAYENGLLGSLEFSWQELDGLDVEIWVEHFYGGTSVWKLDGWN